MGVGAPQMVGSLCVCSGSRVCLVRLRTTSEGSCYVRAMILRLLASGIFLLAGSLAVPTQSLAQGGADRLDDAARAVFDAGAEAYDAGRIEEALRRFENAYELSGRSLIIYNVALCLDRLDRREEATTAYARFLREAPNAPRVPLARARLAALRDTEAGEATGIAETPEEEQGPAGEQNDGTPDADEAVDGTPEDTDAQDEPADDGDSNSGGALAAPATTRPSLVGPIAVLGVGGVGLVTFAIAGILAGSSHDQAADACRTGTCDEDALSAMDRRALIADIGLGLGIAGAVAGTTWLVLALTGADDEPRASVAPFTTPSTAGLQAFGSF